MNPYQYDDDLNDDLDSNPIEQQKDEDLRIAMAKQGLDHHDFPEGIPVGAFIDESAY